MGAIAIPELVSASRQHHIFEDVRPGQLIRNGVSNFGMRYPTMVTPTFRPARINRMVLAIFPFQDVGSPNIIILLFDDVLLVEFFGEDS